MLKYFLVTFLFLNISWAMSSKECADQKGNIVNTLTKQCAADELSIGEIDGTNCPCTCCVKQEKKEVKTLSFGECTKLKGRVVNTLNGSCKSGEKILGEVEGMRCPCICCVDALEGKSKSN